MKKTGRNDECPCGSGKKFKKCCIHKSDQSSDQNPPSSVKISAAILRMLEPLIKKYPQRNRITVLVNLAVIAWNASLVSSEQREDMESILVKHMPALMGAADIAVILEQVDLLVDRKITLFSDINYFIVSHKLTFDSAERLTLDIKSTLFNPVEENTKE